MVNWDQPPATALSDEEVEMIETSHLWYPKYPLDDQDWPRRRLVVVHYAS